MNGIARPAKNCLSVDEVISADRLRSYSARMMTDSTYGKRWSGPGLGLLLAALVSLLAGCASSEQKAAQHIEQAEHWVAKGKISEATLEYRRAIQLDPKSPKARMALARLLMDQHDYAGALQQLERVRNNWPQNQDAQLAIADLEFRTANFAKAELEAKKAVDQAPDSIEALALLAESSLAAKDAKVADTAAHRVLELDSNNGDGWYVKGMLQHAEGDNVGSEKSFRNAITNAPHMIPPVIGLAALREQAGDLKGAEATIRDAASRNPDNVQVRYVLAEFLLEQKRAGDAEEVCKQIASIGEGDPTNRGALARYFVMTGNNEAGAKEYEAIIQRHPDDLENSLELVAVDIELGRQSAAEQLLNTIGKRSPDDPKMLLFRGRLRIDDGQLEDGVRDLRRVTEMQPKWAIAQYFLGLAYMREGKRDMAETAFGAAADLNKSLLAPRVILAALALDEGRPQAAVASLDEALKEKPANVEPYLLRSLALAQEGRTAEAEHDAVPLINQFPQPVDRAITFRGLARVELEEKHFDSARKYANESLKNGKSEEALYLLGVSQIVANHPDSGLGEVENYVHDNPSWAPGYEALGQLESTVGRVQDAENSLRKAFELDPKLASSAFRLSEIEMKQGKLDEAMNLLSQVSQLEPQMASVEIRMGQISEMKGDWKGAENFYTNALNIDKEDPIAKNNLAWVYAEHGGNLDVGLKLAQEAKEASPNSPDISDTLAWILIKKQSYATAAQLLQGCVSKDPRNSLFNYHLGVAYYRLGRNSDAEQYLQTAINLQPNSASAEAARQILQGLSK